MTQNRIPWYANGRCPLDRLIVIREGYNPTDGHWQHRLPRATLRRFRSLVARAERRTGRTLKITEGWATDRPYEAQVTAERLYGIYAATPGKSSHGMVFEGQQTAAIDAGNWAWVYAESGGYDAWLEDLRAEGFDRLPAGYPLDGERHHIIDYNPWDDEPEFGGGPAGYTYRAFEEDDDMYDTNAEQALFAKIEAETRPYKTYQLGTGLILIGDGGATYTIPNGDYQALLIAQGLTSAHVQRIIDGNELAFIQKVRGALSPDPRDAQVQAVLDLTEDDAARIAAAIPAPVLTLTASQVEALAKASADGAREGGFEGAKAAIAGLSFVVTAS